MMKWSSVIVSFFMSFAVLATAAPSYADGELSEASVTMTIRGTVHFEKRSTIVPMINDLIMDALTATTSFCDGDRCPRSNPYWAVIVDDGVRQYELHQPFAIGALRAPQFIEIGGVFVRPGAEVSVEGAVESIGENYGIISDVKRIAVISDAPMPGEGLLGSIYGPEGTGWNCASMEGPRSGVNAVIWYGRRNRMSNESFHLRVVIKRLIDLARMQQGVTDIGNVQMSQVSGNIVYQGTVDDTAATLAIRQNSPMIRNYPSSLSISSMQGSLGVRMLCNPITQAAPGSY